MILTMMIITIMMMMILMMMIMMMSLSNLLELELIVDMWLEWEERSVTLAVCWWIGSCIPSSPPTHRHMTSAQPRLLKVEELLVQGHLVKLPKMWILAKLI